MENISMSVRSPSLMQFHKLEILSYAASFVVSLPMGAYLTNLKVLDLSFTGIRRIPSALVQARKLQVLLLEHCKIRPRNECVGAFRSKLFTAKVMCRV